MKKSVACLFALLTLLLAACASTSDRSHGVSASLVDYLYPKGQPAEPPDDAVPQLQVPLTVGLAFVPGNSNCYGCNGPSGALQAELLERVRSRFADRSYIREIKVIPQAYLRGSGGFTSLEQLSRLYGFDVAALVSYDQVTLGNTRTSSLLYWTLVGAYVIKGNVNDVHTFVDTAVLDVKTRKLLLRAPGIDVRAANATAVENGRSADRERAAGLQAATDQMVENLDAELATFRERIKADNSVIVTRRPGSGGGAGALGLLPLAVLLLAAARRGTRGGAPR